MKEEIKTNLKDVQHYEQELEEFSGWVPEEEPDDEWKEVYPERGENNSCKWVYKDPSGKKIRSPFGLLANVSEFDIKQGDYNEYMLKYGCKVRGKKDEITFPDGNWEKQYFKRNFQSTAKANAFLRRQYKMLLHARDAGNSKLYWNKAMWLIHFSAAFHLATINNFKPTWYKTIKVVEMRALLRAAQKILVSMKTRPELMECWIQSPYPKWRSLAIPQRKWRFIIRMYTDMLAFWLEPKLPRASYHGFIFGRGTKTWWEEVIENRLNKPYIYEFDLKAFFHQVSKSSALEALAGEGGVPRGLASYLVSLCDGPIRRKAMEHLPSAEAKVERLINFEWSLGDRGLPMGIGLSPMIGIWTFHTAMKEALPEMEKSMVSYADDASLFIQKEILEKIRELGKNLQIKYPEADINVSEEGPFEISKVFNWIPSFKKSGIVLSEEKSRWVKYADKWLRNYKSLGLIYTAIEGKPTIMASTRGCPANPILGLKGRSPSSLKLDWPLVAETTLSNGIKYLTDASTARNLDLGRLWKEERRMFGLILARLYTGSINNDIKQNFSIRSEPGSLLDIIVRSHRKSVIRRLGLNCFTASSFCNKIVLDLMYDTDVDNESKMTRILKKRGSWNRSYKALKKREIIESRLQHDAYNFRIGEERWIDPDLDKSRPSTTCYNKASDAGKLISEDEFIWREDWPGDRAIPEFYDIELKGRGSKVQIIGDLFYWTD